MSNYPKVSVVTITYGHEKYIKQTLEGVLMQEYAGEIEFIIANDDSPDFTDQVVNDYFSRKNVPSNFSVKYTRHELNKGMIPNFLWGLEQATGDYIALCEGDDYWTDPLKLQKQVFFLEGNSEFGLLYTDFDRLNQETGVVEHSVFKNKLSFKKNTFEDFLVEAWFAAPSTWVFRSSFSKMIKNNLLNNFVVGDLPILLTISASSKICHLSDVTTSYRVLKESASHLNSLNKKFEFQKGILDIQLFFARQNEVSIEICEIIQKKFYKSTFPTLCKIGDKKMIDEAFKYLQDMQQITFKMKMLFYFSKNRFVYNTANEFYKFFRGKKLLNKKVSTY